MRLNPSIRRKAATMLEYAVVGPIIFFIILALVVGSMGVLRYQEVSHLAREATRYASTHGGRYYLEGNPTTTNVPAVFNNSDVQTFVTNRAFSLDTTQLTATISFSAPATIVPRNYPTYPDMDPTLVPPAQVTLQNYVTVTVTYQWMPELYLVGPINLTSSSTLPISY